MKLRIPNYLKRFFFILLAILIFYFARKSIVEGLHFLNSNYSLDGLAGEVLGGLTTSFLIFLFYIMLMPIIEISPKIYCDENGNYTLKIYNSSVFAAYEVRAIFARVTPEKADKGQSNVAVNDVAITLSYLEYLPSMYSFKAKQNGNTFAVQYTVLGDENISKVLSDKSDSSYYRLTISCKSGITGLRKIKTENYTYKSSVKINKEFASGATFRSI